MDSKVLHALGSRLRVELLDLIVRETNSPKGLAALLDEELSKVAYHVVVLKEAGLIKEVKTKRVRGATEHFYRATLRDLKWAPTVLDPEGHAEVSAVVEKCMAAIQLAHKRSAKRLSKAGDHGESSTVVVASFQSARGA